MKAHSSIVNVKLEQKLNSEQKDDVSSVSPTIAKPNVVRRFISRLFCRHNVEKHIYTCFQDRYVETVCTNCGKHFFRDI